MALAQPISFAYRNLVFGRDLGDAWVVYRLDTRSYAGLTRSDKLELLSLLAGFAYALEADFQLLRVTRPWSTDAYLRGCLAQADSRHAHPGLGDYLESHRAVLASRPVERPEVFLCVRLGLGGRALANETLTQRWLGELRALAGLTDARVLPRRRLEALLAEEEQVLGRLADYLDCERAATHELQWLIRRAYSRALFDPVCDERFEPQALVIEDGHEGLVYRPLEHDLLRLFACPIEARGRSLRIESEGGDSYQALLCLGALPEEVPFPGRRAELLFAPLEALDFPVDACFHARYVANESAVRLVRRRIIDADNIYAEESQGDHGPSSKTAYRPQAARELEEYLTAGERPPLLRAQVSLAVAAASEQELEERIERLRHEYAPLQLHRPLGDQLRLFCSHLPAQHAGVPDYDDYLTVEQFGAMVPLATHAVGSETGPYIGHTLSGSRQPVLFDPTEASRTSRAPATLLAGTLGSGKTLCLELIAYQAFLAGSTVVDIDPKGDHRLERLPGVAERMEVIELSAEERFRGMLDPLRVAPQDTREDLACNFLYSILPEPLRPEWRTEIRLAVQTARASRRHSCTEVVAELGRGNEEARAAARALAVHASCGLARLGFARADREPPEAGAAQVTSLRIRNLTLPLAGTARSELLEDERVGQAVLRLLAVYALHLTARDPGRHAVLCFDEAWVLLADSAGRALVDRISRLGRAQNVTPLLATQVLGDVEALEELIGCVLCFGVETDAEAERALRLLRLDADDQRLRSQLLSFRRGRCLMRDFEGRVGPVQIDLADQRLLDALDTTPPSGGRTHEPDTAGSDALEAVA